MMAIETAQERRAERIAASMRALVDEMLPTRTEREVDDLLAELEEAELLARLTRSAGWRA